jgi:DNA-directed RNA polymerase specialized sigma24 family protein
MGEMTTALADARDSVITAWTRLRPGLERLARRLTREADLREDLLQDALIALWERDPTRFDLREESELAYLLTGLANRMRDTWRAETRRAASTGPLYTARSLGMVPNLWRPPGVSGGGRVPSLCRRPGFD